MNVTAAPRSDAAPDVALAPDRGTACRPRAVRAVVRLSKRARAAFVSAVFVCAVHTTTAPASEPTLGVLDPGTALSGAQNTATPMLSREAAAGLLVLYADVLQGGTARDALQRALDHGRDAVKTARLRDERDGDPLLETSIAKNAALLLELRVLEAIAARLGTLNEALAYAADAESLAAALRSNADTLPSPAGLVWPLVAGVVPSRAAAAAVDSAVLQDYGRTGSDPNLDPVWRLWAFHAAALRQPQLVARRAARVPQDGCEVALQTIATAITAQNLELFAAENPARRLRLAARVLREDGTLGTAADTYLQQVLSPFDAEPARFVAWTTAADSFSSAIGAGSPRSNAIHGSRRDFYRRPGEAVPLADAGSIATARGLAAGALDALRSERGDRVLRQAGWTLTADLDPVEPVPGQAVCSVWSVRAAQASRWNSRSARVDDNVTSLVPAAGEFAAGDSTQLRTGYVSLPQLAPGTALVVPVRLNLDIGDWGTVLVTDRVTTHIVAPLAATLTPRDGMVWDEDTKVVELVVTSRSPRPLAGGLQVLGTAAWTVSPARAFEFTLRRPGQSARQELTLTLPTVASPGVYEVAVRLQAQDETVGTLRARLVKPVRWAVIGPFTPPPGGGMLGPERGVTLESRFPGIAGAQVAWQTAPRSAYDDDGALDFDALYPNDFPAVCAVAFSVFESPEPGRAIVHTEGAARVRWNGVAPAADGSVRIERGRNLLLVRACRDEHGGWRLGVQLTDLQGEPLHVVANDLARLMNGYAALETNAPLTPGKGPVDRLVTLRFRPASDAQEVAVLGTFNAWVPVELQRQPDGTWQRELRLTPGTYAYKLLVDGRLRPDPEAHKFEPDGFGGRNSVLIVR